MGKKVVAVFGDIGGWRDSAGALVILAVKGGAYLEIVVSAEGKAADQIGTMMPFSSRLPGPDDAPAAIVVGTSATAADLQVAWTDFGRSRGIPVIWIEDLYGCGSFPAVRACGGPDVMCVIDHAAAAIAARTWPGTRIVVCGKPSLSFLAGLIGRKEDVRVQVRNTLRVAPGERLLTWWSGGVGADECATLRAGIAPVLRGTVGQDALRLAARLHPTLAALDPAAWQDIHRMLTTGPKLLVHAVDLDRARTIQPEELSIASDIVVGTWSSTQTYVSVLAGVPTIVTALGDAPDQMRELGFQNFEPPHVFVGAARLVSAPTHLVNAIDETLVMHEHFVNETQARAAPLRPLMDPEAVDNIVRVVLEVIA